jgi:hypothetical protein
MVPGLTGSLLSHDAYESAVRDRLRSILDEPGSHRARARLRAWHLHVRTQLGPTATARMVYDRVAAPLFLQLGYRVHPAGGAPDLFGGSLDGDGRRLAGLLVTPWGHDAGAAWRESVHQGIGLDVPWVFCVTGPTVRVIDSRRTYSRRFVAFDLDQTLDNPKPFEIFWGLLRADAMARGQDGASALDIAVAASEDHRTIVRNSLQAGVHEALLHLHSAFGAATRGRSLSGRAGTSTHTLDEALIVIYRILFLLFAEARGLVPRWHPVFRDAYTIESLRENVERLPRPRGLWEALQAIARLAHRGCRIGVLRVPPFNGHLFSPLDAPLSDTVPLDDGAVRQALLALTTRRGRTGRVRVAYGDLGVEQLGGIYERLLDVLPPTRRACLTGPALLQAENRKASGSFYTPRPLTEFLVRRTLAPLVQGASPEQILALRVVDPAMGSGAFLVAACRYLASAYESALIREGGFAATDISDTERVHFRRGIAQQCLFGVDLNPMAVQLGRLSLWLATLAADRPLTFLDHRLRVGNSLIGASLEDVQRQRPGAGRSRSGSLPLFDEERVGSALQQAIQVRLAVCAGPDDTLEQVRAKERAIAALGHDSALARWKTVVDLWCAHWFQAEGAPDSTATFGALADGLLGRHEALPPRIAEPLLESARRAASAHRFFHWSLEFPEIFRGPDGVARPDGGFDAVIGNPPWEMLRGDRGSAECRREAHAAASRLVSFARSSGVYRLQGAGHANLYQLFLERALSLVRPGGRLGMILPSGIATDQGSSGLRRALLDRTALDGILSFENRDGVFPIHRGLKFLLVTGTTGGCSNGVTCRFGVRDTAALEAFADSGFDREAVTLPRPLIERLSGPGLALPELRTRTDVAIVSDLSFRVPALGDPDGWNVRFGRELNATDDRHHFVAAGGGARGLPVVEGKHISPFVVDLSAVTLRLPPGRAGQLLDPARTFGRPRLAYRDVAGATNRLSLIAAVVPAGAVTTHTLLCLKDPLDEEAQHFLSAIFNSFVANYLVRPRIGTHVGAAIIARLAVPRPSRASPLFREAAALALGLSRQKSEAQAARLQACAAQLYGLRPDQFGHILDTLPLVPARERREAMLAFCDIVF